MRITIEFNGLGEIHAPDRQSDVERRIVQAAAKKLPREIAKVEQEIQRLVDFKWHLEDMNRGIQDWAKEDVLFNYITRR